MRKSASGGLLLVICLIVLCAAAHAEADPFSVEKLSQYAALHGDAVSFYEEGSGGESYYVYSFKSSSVPLPIDGGEASGYGLVYASLMGRGGAAYPMLTVSATVDAPLELELSNVLVDCGARQYDIAMAGVSGVMESENIAGKTAYTLSIPLGSAGLSLLSDLAAQDYEMSITVFYGEGLSFSLAQPALPGFDIYYQGLLDSGYIDPANQVHGETALLLANLDQRADLPPVVIVEKPVPGQTPSPEERSAGVDVRAFSTWKVGDWDPQILEIRDRMYELGYFQQEPTQRKFTETMVKYWNTFQRVNGLPETDTISPEDQALLFSENALPKPTPIPTPEKTARPTVTPYIEPEVAIEITRYGDWGRSRGQPWFMVQVRNNSTERDVDAVTLLYACKNDQGEYLPTDTGEFFSSITIRKQIEAGHTEYLRRVTLAGDQAITSVEVAISGIVYADGTTSTVPVRFLNFWRFSY